MISQSSDKITMKRKIIYLLTILYTIPIMAQKGILWDNVGNIPVAHASIYTNNHGNILATSTDANGQFEIKFQFTTLKISHISYEKLSISAITDTIFLTPKSQTLGEISVTNAEPKWIKEKLRSFEKHRKQLYQTVDQKMEYDYDKYNIGDSSGYAFRSRGLMYVPSLLHLDKDSMYKVCPSQNIIRYKDSTADPDFYDMQLMLYENVVSEINNKFVKRHIFRQNESYHNSDKNIVQLVFWSDKYKDDKGTITMDTTQCIILDASRSTGLACNLDEKMNPVVLSVTRVALGLKYDDWTINNTIHFDKIDGIYYPTLITYKYYEKYSNYDKLATGKHKKRMEYFSSKEATLSLNSTLRTSNAHYYDIPHELHSAFIYIESKRHSLNKIAISRMPREYMPL